MGARKILAILAIRTPRPSLLGVFEALARIEEALSARQRAELLSRAARVRDPVPLTSELERVPGRADRARARTSLRFTLLWVRVGPPKAAVRPRVATTPLQEQAVHAAGDREALRDGRGARG